MKTGSSDNADDRGSRLLRAVESIAISPADAQRLAGQYLTIGGEGKDGNGSGHSGGLTNQHQEIVVVLPTGLSVDIVGSPRRLVAQQR